MEEVLPPPAEEEVQVEVKAIGLNFADIFAIWGLYGATPEGYFTPGLEYAGIVTAAGSRVEGVRVGDRVMGVTRFGAYASHLNIDARYVIPIPGDWTFAEGSAYLVQVLTAYYGLKQLGDIQPGQNVLIHSAAGGVGLWANRIARQFGAYTIGTVGSAHKLEVLEGEGYDQGIVRSTDFRQDMENALGGRELHLIMECIGGKIFNIGYDLLAPQGRMIVYGSARYGSVGNRPNYLKLLYYYLTRPKVDPQKMPEHNKSVMGFNLIWLYERAPLMHQLLGELQELNLGKPLIGDRFAFEDLHQAILRFQSGQTIGKVVVELND
ncbi:zinc-binding dehydrogenase [Phaeodactylibacter sp.]|uniref:zinc-binding dehydrogenase n=1 Tax=Phaeodactylibacter sp. TaxID=1940289 RepID=UPI0032EBE042